VSAACARSSLLRQCTELSPAPKPACALADAPRYPRPCRQDKLTWAKPASHDPSLIPVGIIRKAHSQQGGPPVRSNWARATNTLPPGKRAPLPRTAACRRACIASRRPRLAQPLVVEHNVATTDVEDTPVLAHPIARLGGERSEADPSPFRKGQIPLVWPLGRQMGGPARGPRTTSRQPEGKLSGSNH
jgi:hypothetical protein